MVKITEYPDTDNCVLVSCSTCGDEVTFSEEDAQKVLSHMSEITSKLNENGTSAADAEIFENDLNDLGEEMKKVLKLLESGVSIEYRCIKRRSCGDCKRAIETERVSLREAEEQEIWDSVILNFDN